MPLPITHALIPVAAALVRPGRQIAWRLVTAAAIASALPDIDAFSSLISGKPGPSPPLPPLWHRGATHSLFAAIAVALIAAAFHKQLKVRPLLAAVVVGAAMASHGIIDMMTDQGVPVAYLWPLSSERLFADWRPIDSSPIVPSHFVPQTIERLRAETWQLILPMFAVALLVRAIVALRGAYFAQKR